MIKDSQMGTGQGRLLTVTPVTNTFVKCLAALAGKESEAKLPKEPHVEQRDVSRAACRAPGTEAHLLLITNHAVSALTSVLKTETSERE